MIGARNEVFRPVQHPVATIAHSAAFHASHIGTRIRFRHRQRIHALAPHGRQQVTLALVAFTGHQDVLRTPEKVGQRHGAAPQFAFNQSEIDMRQTDAPHVLGKVAGIKPQFKRLTPDLFCDFSGHPARPFDPVLMRINLVLDK